MPANDARTSRALFLDRDGVINVEADYLYKIEHARFMPGIFELCETAQRLGYRLIIVTNQGGIGLGLHSEEEFHALMDWMRAQFAARGIEFAAVYYSPWHPDAVRAEFRGEHMDRKPGPGMILRGAEEFGLDLAASVMVGDRCTDIGAANAAGVGQAFFLHGTVSGPCEGEYIEVQRLEEVREWLLEKEQRAVIS